MFGVRLSLCAPSKTPGSPHSKGILDGSMRKSPVRVIHFSNEWAALSSTLCNSSQAARGSCHAPHAPEPLEARFQPISQGLTAQACDVVFVLEHDIGQAMILDG